jgi:Na+/H+ antiporter NhaC
MDIAFIAHTMDSPSIVAWFALLIVVFAVFMGLGLYESHRSAARQRDADELMSRHQRRRVHSDLHHKETR